MDKRKTIKKRKDGRTIADSAHLSSSALEKPDPQEKTQSSRSIYPEQVDQAHESAEAGILQERVGETLKRWRDRNQLSLQEVENLVRGEIKAPYLSQVERGKLPPPRLDTLHRLAIAYGVPAWELTSELARILHSFPVHDAKSQRHQEIDRAFDYVCSMPDFPTQEILPEIDLRQLPDVSSPEARLAIVLLYERATGLRVLPRSSLSNQEGPASGSGKMEEDKWK